MRTVAHTLALCAVVVHAAAAVSIWPAPSQLLAGAQDAYLDPSFELECTGSCPAPLPAAITRYGPRIVDGSPVAVPAGVDSPVLIKSCAVFAAASERLGTGTAHDESYTLTISAAGDCNITAPTQWGALRGLETLAQAVQWQPANNVSTPAPYLVSGVPLSIKDSPRFGWRGMLVDLVRHYTPLPSLLRTLDAFEAAKINTMHLHLTDLDAVPLEIPSLPNAAKGAYAPEAVYTPAELSQLVQAAWERGIRVLPEIDGPAHIGAWGVGYPDMVLSCGGYQPLLNPLPTSSAWTEVYPKLFAYLAETFWTADAIHIGGDEVLAPYHCWVDNDDVQEWMADKGYTSGVQVWGDIEGRLRALVEQALSARSVPRAAQGASAGSNFTSIVWQEVFDHGLVVPGDRAAVNVWAADEGMAVTAAGLPAIYNFGWYLSFQIPPPTNFTHVLWVETWENYYLNDPCGSEACPDLMLGGELSLWGESVDATNMIQRAWPRGGAAAERLWSAQLTETPDWVSVRQRLADWRCNLLRRGLPVPPVRQASIVGYCRVLPDSIIWS